MSHCYVTGQRSPGNNLCILRHTPIANMATMALMRGFSVATPLLRAGCLCFQVLWPVSTRLDYDLFRLTSSVFFIRATEKQYHQSKIIFDFQRKLQFRRHILNLALS